MPNCFFVSNLEGPFEEDGPVSTGTGLLKLLREGVPALDIGLGVRGREPAGVWKA